MAYRGENIDITIKGDSEYNLDELDFKLLVYPDRHPDEKKVVEKSAMEKLDSNYYSATIGYETTKDLALGLYTIELLVVESETSRSILVKQGSFPVYDSASKDIE